MKKWNHYVFGCLVLIGVFSTGDLQTLASENSLSYEHLTIYVMPQYAEPDDWDTVNPPVLIGIHGTLINHADTAFTEEIRVPVPPDLADFQFSRAGVFDDTEMVDDVEAVLESSGEVVWKPEDGIKPGQHYNFVVEYYFGLEQTDDKHKFSHLHELERDAAMVNILFFEPVGADNFMMSVDADQMTDAFGTPVHVLNFQEEETGKVFDTGVLYYKEDAMSTVDAMAVAAEADDASSGDSPPPSDSKTETFVMIGLSVIIIGLFIFFVWRSKRNVREKSEQQ